MTSEPLDQWDRQLLGQFHAYRRAKGRREAEGIIRHLWGLLGVVHQAPGASEPSTAPAGVVED